MDKIAFLFTGQGAQYAGMGLGLYEKYAAFRDVFEKASERLKIDLKHICASEAMLSKTDNAQAAIFAMSFGIFKLLEMRGINPGCMAGFSLGEITSFAASGMLCFEDALDLIAVRGNAMQKACERVPGAMAGIIGAEDALIEEVCRNVEKTVGYVAPANYNCPKQIVISGETAAVEKAAEILGDKKYRTVKLNVAGAYHSKLMQCEQSELVDFLKSLDFNPPKIPLYSNLTGKRFDFGGDINRYMAEYIPKQMTSPVKFGNELENMSPDCGIYIEIGAGRALSGFVKKTCESAEFANVQDDQTFEAALEFLQGRMKET
ncbi:MAG: ACP S-malonyltransferase [Oscillospiraceae bacterium]|jgi:[acyl-carrier-protein] S-malonyltransferase|nr:ACP S-malonyltransferase [Oscillospiraceae bacterium]